MKVLIATLLCALISIEIQAQNNEIPANTEYTREDSTLVVNLLTRAKTEMGDTNPMLYFARQFDRKPYASHTLEGGTEEHLIVNLHSFDCTTFIESVAALALCHLNDRRTFSDYCQQLIQLRYRQGKMTDYTSRLHYFTWWTDDNIQKGLMSDVLATNEAIAPLTAIQTVNLNLMSTHPEQYKQLGNHPEFIPVIRKYEQETKGKQYRYLPKIQTNKRQNTPLGAIHDGDIVAFTTSKQGVDVTHTGLLYWQNGALHAIHCSSVYKRVTIDQRSLNAYQLQQTSQTGIRVFRIKGL